MGHGSSRWPFEHQVEKNATEFYAQLGVFGAALAVAVPVISTSELLSVGLLLWKFLKGSSQTNSKSRGGYRYVRLTLGPDQGGGPGDGRKLSLRRRCRGRSWRKALTELFLEKYLQNRSFYLLDSRLGDMTHDMTRHSATVKVCGSGTRRAPMWTTRTRGFRRMSTTSPRSRWTSCPFTALTCSCSCRLCLGESLGLRSCLGWTSLTAC